MTNKERSRRVSRALGAGAVATALFVLAALCGTLLCTDPQAGLVLLVALPISVGVFIFFAAVTWSVSEVVTTLKSHPSMGPLLRRLLLPAALLLGCGFVAVKVTVYLGQSYARMADAKSPRSSPARLRQLYELASASEDDATIVALAENPSTPPDVLGKLAGAPSVRGRVALNPNTPARVLRRLARDPNPHVRRSVTGNPSCPREVLVSLQLDANEAVRANARWFSRQRGF